MFNVGQPTEFLSSQQHGLSAIPNNTMEMTGEYAELNVQPVDGSPQFGASSVHFDTFCELLWVGNQGGHLTSYFGPSLQKYTSFHVNRHNHSIVDVLSHDERVFALTKNNLKCFLNRGLSVFDFTNDMLQDNQCMTKRKDHTLLLGGKNEALLEVDLNTASITQSIPLESDQATAIFRRTSKYLCCGGYNGKITLRGLDNLKVSHTLDAHSGSLSDMDANGHTLITCGFSQRPGSGGGGGHQLRLDHFVRMYDLRMMRSLSPIQCAVQPSFLRFLSTYTRRMLVVSQSGQFLMIEDNAAVTPNTPIYQVNLPGTSIMNVDISRSMQAMAFGDSGGYLHLWSSSVNPVFNQVQKSPEFGSFVDQSSAINIDDRSYHLSMVPMPYLEDGLFSDWPSDLCIPVSRRPPPIDPELLRTMKVVQGIGYAPNPGNRRRNQVPYKLKDIATKDRKGKKSAVPDSPLGRDEQPHLYMVPKKYRKVIFKYSKLSEEESEMLRHYNKTNFPGLEPNIPNAYCNCMLQVFYFLNPLRCGLKSHHNLYKEFDLAEELGFLFHMLDSASNGVLRASNFLRAFRTIPEATALGLLKNASKPEQMASGGPSKNLSQLIQNWHRFILQQLHTETVPVNRSNNSSRNLDESASSDSFNDTTGNLESKLSLIEKLFGTEMKINNQFRNGQTAERSDVQFLFNLTYPVLHKPGDASKYVPFSSILKNSISTQIHTKSWDQASETYQPLVQTKTPVSLPDVLALNCGLNRDEDKQFWSLQSHLHAKKFEPANGERSRNPRFARDGAKQLAKGVVSKKDAWNLFAEKEGLDALAFDSSNKPGWMPFDLAMTIDDNGQLLVKSDNDPEQELSDAQKMAFNQSASVQYELFATVCHVDDPRTGGNLVAHINIGESYHIAKEGVTHSQWYLFNDFQIAAIDKNEAAEFDLKWKIPCIAIYRRVDLDKRHSLNIRFPLYPDILLPTASLSKAMKRQLSDSLDQLSPTAGRTFTPLAEDEYPSREGVLIALDAEFVTLNPEEAELHSDGTRSTIKPSHMLVARISLVRGEGPLEGEPFIDDYITTQEQVVDYLTKFSGIKPGDLDVTISSKHLSTLKVTYCKLRYLIECGCVLVGHGLSKDFKVINIHVPEKQIKDTVHLFHLPRKRYVSLRFLAYYFLDEKIQKDMHDSIEDARTALKLYRKYLELTENETKIGEFQQSALKRLYEDGRRMDWKVPSDDEVDDD